MGPAGFCVAPSSRFYETHQLTGQHRRALLAIPVVVAQEGLDRLKREGRKRWRTHATVGSLAFHLARIPDRAMRAGSVPAGLRIRRYPCFYTLALVSAHFCDQTYLSI